MSGRGPAPGIRHGLPGEPSRAARPGGGRAGFTLPELLVFLSIGGLVVGSIVSVIIRQERDYARQQELIGLRANLRDAGTVLAAELRGLSAAEGDLVEIDPGYFVLRARRGGGVVCDEVTSTDPTFTLTHGAGELTATAEDSALVYAHGSDGVADDTWKVLKIQAVLNSGGGSSYQCDYGATFKSTIRVTLAGDTAGIGVGSALLAFRQMRYQLFEYDSRWWLGRRPAASGSFQVLAGPMSSPSDSGFVLTYFDRDGNTTNVPTEVATVEIFLRTRSELKLWSSASRTDTLRTRVSLRG